MKLRTLAITVTAAFTLAMSGCSTSPTNAQIGTGVGAVAGGLIGDDGLGGTDAERRVVVERVVPERTVVHDVVAAFGEVMLQLRRELEARVIGRDVDAHAPILGARYRSRSAI